MSGHVHRKQNIPHDITKLKRCDSTAPNLPPAYQAFIPRPHSSLLLKLACCMAGNAKATRPGRMARARAAPHYRQNAQPGGQSPSPHPPLRSCLPLSFLPFFCSVSIHRARQGASMHSTEVPWGSSGAGKQATRAFSWYFNTSLG